MNIELRQYKNGQFASAKDIHKYLEVKTPFSAWAKTAFEVARLKPQIDFFSCKLESTGGRPMTDYLLIQNAAIKVVLQSRMSKSIELADFLIDLFQQKQKGLSFTHEEITALIDMSKQMVLVSIQKKVESRHHKIYDKPENWWHYRARLLGYTKIELEEAMKKLNKKHSTVRNSLIKLDADELIRRGVFDLLIILGKPEEYALNASDLCKKLSQKMKLMIVTGKRPF